MTHDDALASALGPLLLGSRIDDDLRPALDAVAESLREEFGAEFAAVRAVADEEDQEDIRGVSFSDPALERVFGPAVAALPAGGTGLGGVPSVSGEAVLWEDILSRPGLGALAARLRDHGIADADLRSALDGATALLMPLSTSESPRLGSAVVVRGPSGAGPLGPADRDRLSALAPAIAAAVQNALLRDRNRRSRLTLEAVLATTPNGVWVIDRRGRLALANRAAAAMFDVDFAPLLGRPVRELIADPLKRRFVDPDAWEERLAWLLDHPGESAQDTLETVGGRVLERFSAPVRDAHGTLIGRVMITSDVTEERRALAEARLLADEKARLLAREERRLEEEAALGRAAQALATGLTRGDVHERLLDQASALLWVDRAAVLVSDRTGRVRVAAGRGLEEGAVDRVAHDVADAVGAPGPPGPGGDPLLRLLERRVAFLCGDARDEPGIAAILGGRDVGSFVMVPLVSGERPYGALCVASARRHAFGERELRMLEGLTRLGSAALQNALLFEHERHTAETLQRALLEQVLPAVDGLRLAVLYRAAAGSLVGGDLYSVWPLPGGRAAVLVGDVSGKGVEAAGVTAMVRHMAEALTLHTDDPGVLMAELDGLLSERLPSGRLVTAFLVVLDPAADRMRWASAGHPPPYLLPAGRPARTLEDPGPPLGALPGASFPVHEEPFAPGDVLFLHTDGLAEARRGTEPWGEERLRAAVEDAREELPDRLATTVYAEARAWAGGRLSDDVAIAVVCRAPLRAAGGSP